MMRLPNNIGNGNNTQRNNMQYRIPPVAPIPVRPPFDTPKTLPGFYINSEDEITAGDVQMDGSIAFFPYKDLSRIAVRQWNSSGVLEKETYVLEPRPETVTPAQNEPQAQLQGPVNSPSPEESALITVLNGLNQGLSATFNQFGSALQSIQERLDTIDQRFGEGDGGCG